MSDHDTYARCGICSTHLVAHRACRGKGCSVEDCKDGHVCPKCCQDPGVVLRGSGWSPTASMVALKRWAEGVASLTKGIELMPLEPEKAYYNRAIALEELGKVREAYFDYLKAAELAPLWEQPKMQLTRFTVRKAGGVAK